MPNDDRIIIPRHIKLKVPRKMIYPKAGQLVMECGNCGQREFGVYVAPSQGTAKVKEIVCTTCGKFYNLDPKAHLGGGHITKRGSESGTVTS